MDKTRKLNFFKKLYYSLFKLDKYPELLKEGFKNSLYYIIDIIIIMSIIYSAIVTLAAKNNTNNLKECLKQNLPEFTYTKGTLLAENENTTIIDENIVKANFGARIIINTNLEKDVLLESFKEEPSIILTKDQYVTIDSEGNSVEYDYNEILQQYFGKEIEHIDKEETLYLFDNISYPYYFIIYSLSYAIANFLIILIFNLIASVIIFITCKTKKMDIKFTNIYTMGMYTQTFLAIGYLLTTFIVSTISVYIQIILMSISVIYLIIAVRNKWIKPE